MSTEANLERNRPEPKAVAEDFIKCLSLENLTRDDIDQIYNKADFMKFIDSAGITDPRAVDRFFGSTKTIVWRLTKKLRDAEDSTTTAQRRDLIPLRNALAIVNEARRNQSDKIKRGIIYIAVLEEQVSLGKAASIDVAFTADDVWSDINGEVSKIDPGRRPGADVNDPWFETSNARRLTKADHIIEMMETVTAYDQKYEGWLSIYIDDLPKVERGRPPEVEVRAAIRSLLKLYERSATNPAKLLKRTEGYRASRSFIIYVEAVLRPVLMLSFWEGRSLKTAIANVIAKDSEKPIPGE
jgi:hypothetical protein